MTTGLSIKTLSEALARCSGRMTLAARELDHTIYDYYERMQDHLLAALAEKSEYLECLEKRLQSCTRTGSSEYYRG